MFQFLVKIRSETYKKRKAHLIRVLKEKSKKLEKLQEKIAGFELKELQEKRKVGEVNQLLSSKLNKDE